jgi:hypothetical protein
MSMENGNKTFILANDMVRKNAQEAIKTAPQGFFVTIKQPTRSLMQNNRLWALLTDVSQQVDWYGRKLAPQEWKDVFTAAMKKQDVVPGIEGGFVVLGRSTSNMTKAEMNDLQEIISAFGAQHDVKWSE